MSYRFWNNHFFYGTRRGDTINGTDGRDWVFSGRGADNIDTGAGNDLIFAGAGRDIIKGGEGNDYIDGGRGFDIAVYDGSIDDYSISTRHGWWSPKTIVLRKDDDGNIVERDVLKKVEAIRFEADDYQLFLNGRNNAVLARDDTASTDEDNVLTLTADELIANDQEFDGDTITLVEVSALSAAGASVSLVDGEVVYDPGTLFDALGDGETAQDTFTYTVDDGKGGTDTATVTVTINGVNDGPVLMAPTAVSYAENDTALVAQVSATDAEGDAISFGIAGGADAGLFAIDQTTGDLSFLASPDFEAPADEGGDNVYDVVVSADDGNGGVTEQAIAVTVTDVDELPVVNARINEFHYDNDGGDTGEFVEIRTDAGDDVSQLSITLYNGNGGAEYADTMVSSLTMTTDGTYDYYVWEPSSIQNGSPDGIALANGSELIEFVSYEGAFAGVGGVADGVTSTDIGESQSGDTPVGSSLQRSDDGTVWNATDGFNTSGTANATTPPLEARINEFHYDNAGGDVGEFVELRVNAGGDASALTVELYNGNNGSLYNTLDIADASTSSDGTYDYYVFDLPANGLQNGAPDGLALVDGADVVEFLSYEGNFTATDGTASGLTSTDIGASEPGTTLIDSSLQRSDDGSSWALTDGSNTSGAANSGGTSVVEARLNEFHYDNDGVDGGEFIEVRVSSGGDVSGLSIDLYNGSNGMVYNSLAVSGGAMTSDADFDYYVVSPSSIQNGSPDGIALSNNGELIEFLSYEGTLTGSGGAADGVTSTDVGVAQGAGTPAGASLERSDDGATWMATDENSSGAANGGEIIGEPTPLLIHEVQGSGSASTRVGELVTITAIVVGDFQNGDGDTLRDLGGFFLQEEDADADGDAATSEGIFVFDGAGLTDVNIGDRVEVTGTVDEFFGQTQISASSVSVVEAGAVADINTMAQTIVLDDVDDVVTDGEGGYLPDLEAYEGMLVSFSDTLTINEMFQLDRFNEIKLTAGDRPEQFTQSNEPDVAGYDAYLQGIGSDQIVFDDGLGSQNAPIFAEADLNGDGVFNDADGFSMGDQITGLTGVLDYSFNEYRVRSVEDDANTFVDTGLREETPPDVGGDLTVASFNVLNFFTTLDEAGNPGSGPNGLSPRGADNAAEFDRQLDKLTTTLVAMDADVVGLVELENEFGSDQNGDGQFAIGRLVDALNAKIGTVTYSWVDPGRSFVDTGDAISVGLIYKPTSVTLSIGSVEILDDSDLDGLGFGDLDDDGTGVFDGVSTNRAPLAATFIDNASGEDFTVAVTHMKSKGGAGTGDDADQNDGAGNFNALRTEGVDVLTVWLDEIGDTDVVDGQEVAGDVLVVGDFNAYAMEDPIDAMIADGYSNLEEQFDPGATTFVFDGQTGTLDYAFANGGLQDNVSGAAAWEINSAEPDAIDYNLDFGRDPAIFDGTTPYRTSDHDPLLIGLDFTPDDTVFVS